MFDYIDNDQALAHFLKAVKDAAWVALDTEFIREKTYFPKLCLLQLATTEQLACIDPLTIQDLTPLLDWLNNPTLTKVFHAASQDLEILYYLSNKVPAPIFDTQITAAVLGLGDQLGYAKLVEAILGLNIDKSQSRTDWSRRPLRREQLEYAIDDVRHLRTIYPLLQKRLRELERQHWVDKPFARLTDPANYIVDPRSSWMRVKNIQILKPQQLSMLREVAAWREEQALQKDIPRRWLVSDDILLDMARMKITQVSEFEHIRGLQGELIQRYGSTWLSLLQTGANLPPEQYPQLARRRQLDEQLSLVIDLLMLVVNQQALVHNISPHILATRPQIEKMLTEGRTAISEDWRGGLLNELFADLLSGKSRLGIEQQQLVIRSAF